MYRLHLDGQPEDVPSDVVFRIAPDAAMGAKELAVQQTVADLGFATPQVRLTGPADDELGGTWSVMDFAAGHPTARRPQRGRRAAPGTALFARLPGQLAEPMAALHALDPEPGQRGRRRGGADRGLAGRGSPRTLRGRRRRRSAGPISSQPSGRWPTGGHPRATTVICHGDLHPFNLLVDDDGDVTVIDWTAAIRAEPAYDVAFTSMLLANPPLDAPGPARRGHPLGRRPTRSPVRRSLPQPSPPTTTSSDLDWYRALHGARILIEAAWKHARDRERVDNQSAALIPAAASALDAATGAIITTPS